MEDTRAALARTARCRARRSRQSPSEACSRTGALLRRRDAACSSASARTSFPGDSGCRDSRSMRRRRSRRGDADPDAYLFTGCVMDAWQRDIHRATLRVMRATGARVGLPGPAATAAARCTPTPARRGQTRVARPASSVVPGRCADRGRQCRVWRGARRLRPTARNRRRPRILSRVATSRPGSRGHPACRFAAGHDRVVQDPCHLRHVQRAHARGRSSVGPTTCVDTDDDGLCCGAGGAYSAFAAGAVEAVRTRKVERCEPARPGQPFVVASANPGCTMHLRPQDSPCVTP